MILYREKGGKAPTPPAPTPPITESDSEVMNASRMEQRTSRRRRGQLASIFAGREDDQGGVANSQVMPRGLLGGGGTY